MDINEIRLELARVNSSAAFWQALGSNNSHAGCAHDYQESHSHEGGNFLKAQNAMAVAMAVIFDAGFDASKKTHRDCLFNVSALSKAQDQISGGKNFISQKTRQFNQHFEISDKASGRVIAGETRDISDAKKYLIKKFALNNALVPMQEVIASNAAVTKKARDLLNLGWLAAVNPLIAASGSLRNALPSLLTAGLALGTAQLILRATNQQNTANSMRDNIGASTEAAAFFVLVNGALENASHSFLLASPAFSSVMAYEGLYRIYKNCAKYSSATAPIKLEDSDLEMGHENSDLRIAGSFLESKKAVKILQKIVPLLAENEMWVGLRKRQLYYVDNTLEDDLQSQIPQLINELKARPQHINNLLQKDFNQPLNDAFEMLKAYNDVLASKNPGNETAKIIEEFCDFFARDAILLTAPSPNAQVAAFCCRAQANLVKFEDRVKASLPHLPNGEQVFMAAVAIGALFSASAIYKEVTGEEESYTSYVTDFPDHLFSWLQLDQMYDNMGGGAAVTEAFKNFFGGFNLAENSTHIGIAIAPFALSAKKRAEIFDSMHHGPANLLGYALDCANHYADGICSWFKSKAQENAAEIEEIEMVENQITQSAQASNTPLENLPEDFAFCGSGADFLLQFNSMNSRVGKSPSKARAQKAESQNLDNSISNI